MKTRKRQKAVEGGNGGARRSRAAVAVATSARKPVKERVAAISETSTAVCDDPDSLDAMLKVLRDRAEPSKVRLAALAALQAASFSVIAFEGARSDYLAALRSIMDDPDAEVRQRVLGLLARERDGQAQKKLLEGLKSPAKALVPPEKALQLLSYDVHAEAYGVAREIVKKPPSAMAKREALRLLAADATAMPMFEKILRDKNEAPEMRRLAASALQGAAPKVLQRHARAIVLDPVESDEVRAATLTAITQFGNEEEVGGDVALKKRVAHLEGAASGKVKQTARRFMKKYKA